MPATIQDIRLRPDYLAMVAAESPHSLAQLIEEAAAELERSLLVAGKPVLELVSPRPVKPLVDPDQLSPKQHARWLIRACGFRL